jgi:cyclophilin family peptidyl-prolyl cis-trans isomerase
MSDVMGRRTWWSTLVGSSAIAVLAVGCGEEPQSGRWVTAAAVSPDGYAFELALEAQPVPEPRAGDAGFTRFAMRPAGMTVRNLTPGRATTALAVDVYLFHDCGLLSTTPPAASPSGESVIARDSWSSGDERFVAPDGGYCVQRLAPVPLTESLEPDEAVTVSVGLEDVGFVAPDAEAGRIETMLGTPRIVQFGIRRTDGTGSDFYSPRITVGGAAVEDAATVAATSVVPGESAVVSIADATPDAVPGATVLDDTVPDDTAPGHIAAGVSTAPVGAAPCPNAGSKAERRREFDQPPPSCLDLAARYQAIVSTNVGEFTVELDPGAAPMTVNNFVYLTRYGYYDDTTCHRAVKDFVVQCGDPTGTGFGGPGYAFDDELPTTGYELGDVVMANSGPDTNGSQFFVVTGPDGAALSPDYTRFGRVTAGFDTTVAWMNAMGAAPGSGASAPSDEIRITSITITTT